jgi:hypothetical protein
MSYVRIYPSRNTTIFKRNSGSLQEVNGLVNTGKNPIFELMDGNSYSTILMSFDLGEVKSKLKNFDFTCNLKLWDAGVLFEPTIKLKTIDLLYFTEEFVEGDGFSFLGTKALPQATNWVERVTGQPWNPDFFSQGLFPALQLNDANEDILIPNLENYVTDAISNEVNPNFGIRISENTVEGDTFTKFLHSRHTRTIFKPYLEIFISDDILDSRYNCVAGETSKVYLLTDSKKNLVGGTVTCEITDNTGTVLSSPGVFNPNPGVYYIEFTPNMTQINSFLFDNWKVGTEYVAKNLISIKSPNVIKHDNNKSNLVFYPTTSYVYPSIRKGDVVAFSLVSEIRGRGAVLFSGYEYRVICTNGFEMQPWTKAQVYNQKIFFYLNTSYYFPELEYEVFVRLKDGEEIKTSGMTYKFRLVEDTATRLADRAANPYNSRDTNFKR